MTKIGVVARADRGGLAALSLEVWRHLRAERVLVVDLGDAARGGHTDVGRYDAPWSTTTVTQYQRGGFEIDRFLDGLDVCYSAETVYEDRIYQIARQHRCAVVLHCMPELFGKVDNLATALWAPTDWEIGRLPARTELVPVPVALDRFTYRRRTRCDTIFATTGEAMLDRNGWEILRAALPHVRRPLRLLWRGPLEYDPRPVQVGLVTMQWLPPVENYWDVIPAEADLLVMPRRYGGLALPVQEAAAAGVPAVMTALSPQTGWIAPDLLVPTTPGNEVQMKGGRFMVHQPHVQRLAGILNELIDSPARMDRASLDARKWAESIGWDVQLAGWQARLDELGTRR